MAKQPKNIFDAASQHLSKKPAKEKKSKKERVPFEIQDTYVNTEAKEMIDRIKELNAKMSHEIQTLFSDKNITPYDLERYLNNKNNFSKDQWEFIKAHKEMIEDQVKSMLNVAALKKADMPNRPKDALRKRTSKTLGSRKNWLSMR